VRYVGTMLPWYKSLIKWSIPAKVRMRQKYQIYVRGPTENG
jgi:hypothetical protein